MMGDLNSGGAMPDGPGCQPTASAPDGSSQSGIPIASAAELEAVIVSLSDKLDAAVSVLRKWDEWEGAVLMAPNPWQIEDGFAVAGGHYDDYLALQSERVFVLLENKP